MMKNNQQLLKEQKQLKTKLAQVKKQISLNEVARMQQLAGIKCKHPGLNENKFDDEDYKSQKQRVLEWFDLAFEGKQIDTQLRSQIKKILDNNNSMTKELFRKIWGIYVSKYSTHDVGADWDTFDETFSYIMTGNWDSYNQFDDEEEWD